MGSKSESFKIESQNLGWWYRVGWLVKTECSSENRESGRGVPLPKKSDFLKKFVYSFS